MNLLLLHFSMNFQICNIVVLLVASYSSTPSSTPSAVSLSCCILLGFGVKAGILFLLISSVSIFWSIWIFHSSVLSFPHNIVLGSNIELILKRLSSSGHENSEYGMVQLSISQLHMALLRMCIIHMINYQLFMEFLKMYIAHL